MGRINEDDLRLTLCAACGTQFDVVLDTPPKACHICDDPRQYVPATGQAWTCLADIQPSHKNTIEEMPGTGGLIYTIRTEPHFPIGQRAFLIRTPNGNVLWDLVALLDEDTIRKVDSLGGINAMVISHPHFYTTHLTWSRAFGNVPVYLSAKDAGWLARKDTGQLRRFIDAPTQDILGTIAIRTGGHFPGSMVLLWERRLFVADSAMVTPAGVYDGPRPSGTAAFTFLWSYPNRIPLPPAALADIVRAIEPFEFDSAHAAFHGLDVARDAKRKLIESARIAERSIRGFMPGEDEAREFWR